MHKITVSKHVPYLVSGDLPLIKVSIGANAEGESVRYEWTRDFAHPANYALCRCGGSANKPFCDGSHAAIPTARSWSLVCETDEPKAKS